MEEDEESRAWLTKRTISTRVAPRDRAAHTRSTRPSRPAGWSTSLPTPTHNCRQWDIDNRSNYLYEQLFREVREIKAPLRFDT